MDTPPTPEQQEDVDAEAAAWANVDTSDPVAVARALAAVGARAGAKVAVLEHMNDRVGRALDKLDEATAALNALVPRTEMEAEMAQLRKDVDDDRKKDRQTSRRRFVGLVIVGLLFAAIVISAVAVNRAAISRAEDDAEDRNARTDAVAICASTYPGDRAAIIACVNDQLGVPSQP
jgi:HAMP domain-containing protein